MVFPVVLGSGKHLFRDESDTSHLRLTDTQVFSSGAVLLTYRPTDESPTSKYVEAFAWTREAIRSFQAAQNPDRVLAEQNLGRYVKSTGDGLLATFDAPTRALRCAFELNETLAGVGLAIRSAIHTGEIEVREDDVGGIGVHIAARALGEAGDGHVIVTRTVRDLATGTDLSFSPLGSVQLRGVPGEWELFEASID
jgi:hypothetical protein